MSSFGERLEELRTLLGLTKTDMSGLLGISLRRYIQYVKEGKKPTFDTLRTIAEKIPSLDMRWLITGKGTPFMRTHGLVEIRIRTSLPGTESTPDTLQATLQTQMSSLVLSDSFAKDVFGVPSAEGLTMFPVLGDAMEPLIPDGALVFVRNFALERVIWDGKIYAIRHKGKLFIRRIEEIPGRKLILHPENKKYLPVEIEIKNHDVEIVGRVVGLLCSL